MTLPNLKDLKKLIKLCRAEGVTTVRVGELELHLGEKRPEKAHAPVPSSEGQIEEHPDEWEGLSDEEKLLWSALPTVNDTPVPDPAGGKPQ